MAPTGYKIEVIELTGDDIDGIAPEESVVPTTEISTNAQTLFGLPALLPRNSISWLEEMLRGARLEPSPPPSPVPAPPEQQDEAARSRSPSVEPPFEQGERAARSRSSSVEFLSEQRVVRAAPPPTVAPTGPRLFRDPPRDPPQLDARRRAFSACHALAALASARYTGAQAVAEGSEMLLMYTDGSVKRNGGGAGVAYHNGHRWAGRAFALGSEIRFSSGIAELSAIYGALKLARTIKQPGQARITIATDSTSCLNWLGKDPEGSDRANGLVSAVLRLQRQFDQEGVHVTFQWVKGHAGIEGNEVADALAGYGSSQASTGLMMHWDIPDAYEIFPQLAANQEMVKTGAEAEGRILQRIGATALANVPRRARKLAVRRAQRGGHAPASGHQA